MTRPRQDWNRTTPDEALACCDESRALLEKLTEARVVIAAHERRTAELRAALADARSMQKENDMNLLRKLASGEGGRRTGALKRAGYLEWTVTEKGLAALADPAPREAEGES